MQDDGEYLVSKRGGFHATSLGTGALEFIPVPFLDEWLIRRQWRGMAEKILTTRGIAFEPGALEWITGSGISLSDRLGYVSRGLILMPLRKLFRSVLFWLTAKRAARTAMVTYFLARFLLHKSLLTQRDSGYLTAERAILLGGVFRDVADGIDIRAAKSAIREVVRLFARKGDASGVDIGTVIEESAPGFVARFDMMVAQRLA